MASQLALGRLFDISAGVAPADFGSAAATGNRVSLANCDAVTVVVFKEPGTDTEPLVVTLQEHTVASSGTPQALAKITEVYKKTEATLDGDEAWVKVTQAAGSTFTEAATDDTLQAIYAFTVSADSLSDGYKYISVNVADPGTAGTTGAVLYLLHDLKVKRAPANMPLPITI